MAVITLKMSNIFREAHCEHYLRNELLLSTTFSFPAEKKKKRRQHDALFIWLKKYNKEKNNLIIIKCKALS